MLLLNLILLIDVTFSTPTRDSTHRQVKCYGLVSSVTAISLCFGWNMRHNVAT